MFSVARSKASSDIFFSIDHPLKLLCLSQVACILAVTGWSASQPIVEDPSITCAVCGKEVGLWNYKTLANRGLHKILFLHNYNFPNPTKT